MRDPRDIFTENVVQRQGVGHRLNAGQVHFLNLGDIFQNRFQLGSQPVDPGIGQVETG